MRLFINVLFLTTITGMSFAQIIQDPTPIHRGKNLLKPVIEDKSITARTLLLHPEYDVLTYDINMVIFPDSQKIEAKTSIRFVITTAIENDLLFDFAGLELDSVLLDSDRVQGNVQGELLYINLEIPLMAGDTHLVRIHYQGTPEKGLYFRSNFYEDLVIYSHNEPYDAHFWFPCKDDPSDKARLGMSVTVPDQFVVLGNGILIDEIKLRTPHTRYIWQEDYPIATYLISIAAAPYVITTNSFTWDAIDLPLAYYVYSTDVSRGATALEMVIEMLNFYSSFIGEYPFFSDKYSMSEVPLQEAAAMENQTATTMRDTYLDNEEIIAHELAHQWWGDALTPESFVDIWLNEGFASYFDALFTEYKYGEEAFLQRMEDYRTYLETDGSLAYPIYDPPPQYLFGRAVYFKGAWVLHMLRYEVGDEIFKEIIQRYYEEYNYQNVHTVLFVENVEFVSGQSFTNFFDQWLNYGGIPLLIGSWEQDNNLLQLSVRQDQPEPVYQFDLEILVEGISSDTLVVIPVFDRESKINISFGEPVSKIIIDPNDKILCTTNSPVHYIPTQSGLVWLYPNPFNETITISYQTSKTEKVEIIIYDILGQIVDVLLDEKRTTGIHQVDWDGSQHSSGNYYCVMKASSSYDVKKMTLIK